MSLITEKKVYYIDSHQRVYGPSGAQQANTDSNFFYMIDMHNFDFDQVCVLQANIPKSYYLVQSGQNTFTLIEGSSSILISFPIGNYGRSSFKTQLQALLNTYSPNGYVYSVTIPNSTTGPDTGLYYFSVTGNAGVQPQFTFTIYLYEQFGFNSNTTNTFVANSLVSTNVIKMQKEDSIYIHSDICANDNDNILQEIFGVSSPDYGNILFMTPSVSAYSKNMSTSSNNLYQFWITDEDSNPINLNGQNVVFTIICYKKQNVWGLIKNFIKLKLLGNN
jgi:hypothetical protein